MDKLAKIREQKQRLKKRVLQLEGNKGESTQLTEQAMKALLQKKAKLEHERFQQQKYRKMQEEYLQRKAQVQREKQLQKIKNEKRMIQLQVGMKRIVMNGVQEKVKGINSDQLMARIMLSGDNVDLTSGKTNWQVQKSRQQIRGQFQKYLQKQAVKKQKPKHDLFKLNEKRFELFEKKQELLMREILLKQVINKKTMNSQNTEDQDEKQDHVDVMKMTRQQMEKMLADNNINIEEYMYPLDQKQLLENLPTLQSSIQENLKQKKQQVQQEDRKRHNYRKLKAQLKDWVRSYPNKNSINQIQQLIDQILESIIFQYEKRHFPLTRQQRQQKLTQIEKEYETILLNNEFYQFAEIVTDKLIDNLKKQMLLDVASETHQLHQFAHQTTAKSFDWLFQRKSYLDWLQADKERLQQIHLQYVEPGDDITFDKRKQNLKAVNDPKKQSHNIFQTQNSTSQLIHDLKLLTAQEQFFQLIQIQLKRQIIDSIEEDNFLLKNQGSLYVITSENIKLVSNQKDTAKTVITFKKQIKNIKNVKKLNNTWIILNNENVFVCSQWNVEILPLTMGQRINSPSGSLSTVQIFPIFTLFGSLCSVILGFEKGQVMKYNFNRNRITSIQTNVDYYQPLGPVVKTGDEAAFPLHLGNMIQYSTQKPTNQHSNNTSKPKGDLHEFREFFDHHNQQIVSVCFYKQNMFITIDKSMHCSIWLYDHKRGVKSYQPFYQFIIKSDYTVYKQSDNPRFQDLYPSPNFPQTPQKLYNKWMQQQTYLKQQIYNNPKKNTAHFKTPGWNDEAPEQPVWKFNYDSKTKKVLKIFSTHYNLSKGKSQCRQVKLWKDNIVLLVERQHVMRTDLKTIKIFIWSIEDKKLKSIAIEFDTFQQQKSFNFEIIPNSINNTDHPLIATISSGKILIYSMLSGQLLKDISQEPSCSRIKSYNFFSIQNGYFSNFYGSTKQSVAQFVINNKNSKQKSQQFIKTVQITRKKYNNLA